MKKTLFFIFAANLFFAQNPELLNTNWQVTKYIGEQFPNPQVPPSMPNQQFTQINSTSPQINLSFFNTVSANLTFIGQNEFRVNDKTCTSANYTGDNGQVNQFFELLCNFFHTDMNFYYTIVNNGNEKILSIGNPIFQGIDFKSSNLSTKDNELSKVIIYPNPAIDFISVENLKPNSSLELIDNSGKLVKSISNIKTAKTEINIKNLTSGIYYLKVDGQSVQKIIKK